MESSPSKPGTSLITGSALTGVAADPSMQIPRFNFQVVVSVRFPGRCAICLSPLISPSQYAHHSSRHCGDDVYIARFLPATLPFTEAWLELRTRSTSVYKDLACDLRKVSTSLKDLANRRESLLLAALPLVVRAARIRPNSTTLDSEHCWGGRGSPWPVLVTCSHLDYVYAED